MLKNTLITLCILVAPLFASNATSSTLWSPKTIKGNKKIVTKEIKIGDFDKISLAGSNNVYYELKETSSPFLSVEIDENLVEYLDIKVENKELLVRIKNGTSFSATRFIIRTNSTKLSAVDVRGSGNAILGNIKANELDLTVRGSGNVKMDSGTITAFTAQGSGSGNIHVDGKLKTASAIIKVQGSGGINIKDIESNKLQSSVSGSGDIKIAGKAEAAEFNANGSGSISAKEVEAKDVRSTVRGSGSINLWATQSLDASVAGSGSVGYRGNPAKLQKSERGSGRIKSIN